jgi:hypothetical protein
MSVINLRPKTYRKGRGILHRRAKLGDVVDRVQGTPLDTAPELDELIRLNRGAAPGELTPIVEQLVADAVAGKPVSARAYSANAGLMASRKLNLIAAWNRRMIFSWEQASKAEQVRLIEHLMERMKKEA